jgi:hypothetical protein
MASLPNPNPIDAGHMHRGGAVDHLGNSTIHCWACDSEQRVELYKMILGRHFGFGAPIYVKPFQKHSSTRGKVGRKGTYALCCNCGSLLAQDDGARRSLEANGFSPKGIMSEQAGYQLINRIVDDPEYPESEPASAGLPPTSRVRKLDAEVLPAPELEGITMSELPENSRVRKLDAEVVEPPEPEVQESEVVELPEETKVRQGEPEPAADGVDESPEVARLQEKLKAVEREVEQRLGERRQAAEAVLLEAEKARRIEELTQKLEQAEKTLSQVKDPDWRIAEVDEQVAELTPYAKVCKVVCPMCGEMSPFPFDVCPQCFKPQTNQDSRLKMYRCGKCGCVCGETDKSCSLCGAEFAD